ncbi:MAG: Patatin-like serine [Lasallia pustulata]|uniref:Patatin-like phospholipase domain-containing protein n=1 Tax=Lasallia pustulata TaxID=136370 RepID=A0A5M8Q2U5_9LECA|nr:MAG: Patatin-like serine [Lasallia pustulata]
MADTRKATNGPSPYSEEAFDPNLLPDHDVQFIDEADIVEFAKALDAPEAPSVTALNDWRPVRQRIRRKPSKRRKKPKRSKDETREGFVYAILKWPLLLVVFGWLIFLTVSYLLTRFYIWCYEHYLTWIGKRQRLRRTVQSKTNYADWTRAAQELDAYLGNEQWKEAEDYAYYDHKTVRKVKEQLKERRLRVDAEAKKKRGGSARDAAEELRSLVEACVKNNFVGVENPRLYSETYYGTKHLAQEFIDELHTSLAFLLHSDHLTKAEKFCLAKHLHTNFGRTALCLSGGASFAYYHFGVVKALLDASLLPDVITGTSGGALIAAMVATRTDSELRLLLVPALAHHITACQDSFFTWSRRWWRTGARFDSLAWARKCSWFCRGSTTFREAYERTGRILNVSCVPSDPHSPTILINYLTAPNCVIWSAVLASAAVPGILNPVVLMMKHSRTGTLSPYSFGHKWKDGSLRTDIPLKALNTHFNVNFSIVSQVNPHINLFFFSSRGTVGRPVTHRRGRGWRGGFLGSATEQYLKLDLNKWLKVLRHLELLPRPLGQDWSEIWLQRFSGTVTIWPKSKMGDFWYILSDPTPERLARMLQAGQQSTFPKLLFIANRMKIERLIEEGVVMGQGDGAAVGNMSKNANGIGKGNGNGKAHARGRGKGDGDEWSLHMQGQRMRSGRPGGGGEERSGEDDEGSGLGIGGGHGHGEDVEEGEWGYGGVEEAEWRFLVR